MTRTERGTVPAPAIRRRAAAIAVAAAAVLTAAPARSGEIELDFDRESVRDLLVAGRPDPRRIAVPPLGEVVLRLSDPTEVRFVDGGLETRVPYALEPIGLAGVLAVRYVPDVDPESRAVRLVPASASAEGSVPVPFDLAGILPVVRLPRQTGWTLAREDGDVDLVVEPREVRIEGDRLRVRLGFRARRAAP